MIGNIDPWAADSADKVLWCVYGYESWPSMFCCKLHDYDGSRNVWGYSIYRRSPGFRTLGQRLALWLEQHEMCLFFDDQQKAMEYLTQITTPKCDVHGNKIKPPTKKEQAEALLSKIGVNVRERRVKLDANEQERLLEKIALENIRPIKESSSLHWWSEEYIIAGNRYDVGGSHGAKCPEMVELIETIG